MYYIMYKVWYIFIKLSINFISEIIISFKLNVNFIKVILVNLQGDKMFKLVTCIIQVY